jgi:glycerol-3-phosphate dehydrogenase
MLRDLRRLADTRFDLLVIGAGIYGAAAAWDAAARGLSVALIDRSDFGSGTSFHNLKTLHGGLRSLQAMNPRQMRRFIRERRALVRIAPHLVRPLPFIVPTSTRVPRHPLVMRVALALNDLAARDRSDGIADPDLHLPGGRVISRDEALRLNPFVDPDRVTGGAVWYDYQMRNADRMTFSFVLSAASAGGTVANHLAAESILFDGSRVIGAHVRDGETGQSFDIRAAVTVNAAGAWAPALAAALPGGAGSAPAPLLSRAMNVIVRQPAVSHACGGEVDGRFLFLVPWRDVSILGTSHDSHRGGPDALSVSAADLEAFLAEGRRAFPRASLAMADVRLVHRGLLPMVSGNGRHVTLLRESAIVDHAGRGAPGLISVHGVRYTTARETAAEAVHAALGVLGHRRPAASRSDRTPLQGGDMPRVADVIAEARRSNPDVPTEVLTRLVHTYGTHHTRVMALASRTPHLARPLGSACDVTGVEIAYAARVEMARTLADALIRRTEAGSAGHPGDDAIAAAADVMAAELGWDSRRRQAEIESVQAFYRLPT